MEHIKILYTQNYSLSKTELRKLGCPGGAFDDIYHDAFSILKQKMENEPGSIRDPRLYLRQLCRNLWVRERKRQEMFNLVENPDRYHSPEKPEKSEMTHLLLKHLKNISEKCRKILILYSLSYSEYKISRVLNLEDTKMVKNRKYYCKEKLRNLIINDPLFRKIYG